MCLFLGPQTWTPGVDLGPMPHISTWTCLGAGILTQTLILELGHAPDHEYRILRLDLVLDIDFESTE
jgi:hypothetical protein